MVPQKSIKPSIKIGLMNLMPVKPPTETQILRMFGRSPAHVDVTLFVPDTYAAKNTAPEYLSKFYKRWSEIKSEKFDGFIMTGAPIETLPFEEVVLRIRMRAPGQTRIATRCFARYPALRIGSSSSWPAAAAACNIARPAGRVLEGARGLFRARSGDRRRAPHPLLGRHGLPLPLPQGRLPLHTARKRSERSGGDRPPIRRNSSSRRRGLVGPEHTVRTYRRTCVLSAPARLHSRGRAGLVGGRATLAPSCVAACRSSKQRDPNRRFIPQPPQKISWKIDLAAAAHRISAAAAAPRPSPMLTGEPHAAAAAAAAAAAQVPKYITDKKQFGVFPHRNLLPAHPLTQARAPVVYACAPARARAPARVNKNFPV